MKKIIAVALMTAALSATVHAENSVMVGGQSMLPSKDIVDNAKNSADHTPLVAAVKAAGLVETLKSKGPFTVLRLPMPLLPSCLPALWIPFSNQRTRPR